MVLSQLHPAVQYKEQKELYDDDIDMEAKLYDIFFPTMRLRLNIAVGKLRHTATKNGILFFPLYLIHDEKFVMQIGIYEINVNELQEIKDEDDEIDIELIKRDPLLYKFSTQDNLKQYGEYVDDINEEKNESLEEDKENGINK